MDQTTFDVSMFYVTKCEMSAPNVHVPFTTTRQGVQPNVPPPQGVWPAELIGNTDVSQE